MNPTSNKEKEDSLLESSKNKFFEGLEFGDKQIVLIYFLFLCLSFLFISSADIRSSFSFKYLVQIILSIVSFFFVLQMPINWLANQKAIFRSLRYILWIALFTILVAPPINGAHRWINVFGFSLQPSEFLKPLILWLGVIYAIEYKFCSENKSVRPWVWDGKLITRSISKWKWPKKYLRKNLNEFITLHSLYWCGAFMVTAVFVTQNTSFGFIFIFLYLFPFLFDFKTQDIWKGVQTQMSFFGRSLLFGLLLYGAVSIFLPAGSNLGLNKMFNRIPTALNRLHSASSIDSIDYKHLEQEDYALIALCRDPWHMPRMGSSLLRKNLTQSESDFILSFIVEEYGIVFIFLIMGLYVWLFWRLQWLTRRYGDESRPLMRYFYHGFMLLLLMEISIHLVVNADIIVTGQCLPFISKGGSSLLVHSVILALLLNIASFYRKKEQLEGQGLDK